MYKEQIDVVKRIKLHNGQSIRLDCPFCHGRNTLFISKENGQLKWYCFRASCEAHGISQYDRSISDIKFTLKNKHQTTIPDNIPDPILRIGNNPLVLEYLETVNSIQAYRDSLVEVYYSPTENRALFAVKYAGNIVGYTGRALDGSKPKWQKFGDCSHVFACGSGPIGVLVEDAPSACAVGIINRYTGLALLGTHLTTQHKLELSRYKQIIVCLDKDASVKSLKLARQLDGIANTTVRLLDNDLKNYGPQDIESIIL